MEKSSEKEKMGKQRGEKKNNYILIKLHVKIKNGVVLMTPQS